MSFSVLLKLWDSIHVFGPETRFHSWIWTVYHLHSSPLSYHGIHGQKKSQLVASSCPSFPSCWTHPTPSGTETTNRRPFRGNGCAMTHNCWSASCVGGPWGPWGPWSRKRDLWRVGFVWTIPLNPMVYHHLWTKMLFWGYTGIPYSQTDPYDSICSYFFRFFLSILLWVWWFLAHFQVARTFRASCRPSGAEIPQQWWSAMKTPPETSPTCRVYVKYHDFKGITSSYYILFFRIFMGQNRSGHRPEKPKNARAFVAFVRPTMRIWKVWKTRIVTWRARRVPKISALTTKIWISALKFGIFTQCCCFVSLVLFFL